MPEQPKEARPLQENVRYWAVVDRDGLYAGLLSTRISNTKPPEMYVPGNRLVRVTLKAVSDD